MVANGYRITEKIDHEAERLLPAYFAMVMATGIVAIALHLYGMAGFSTALFYIDIGAYAVLWVLSIERIILHTGSYISDLKNHSRGPGFFTVIAGTNTLGSAFLIVGNDEPAAYFMWFLGIAFWLFYQYTVFSYLMLVKEKPALSKGINGGWLVAIVSTQSVAVLGAQLSTYHHELYLVSLIMYMIGWLTYFMVMSMINYRLLFFRLDSADITGPYWINMGATAITTLAGALLLIQGKSTGILSEFGIAGLISPFLIGATFLIWAYGSWWIPWLIIVGAWRHTKGKISIFSYDASFWSAVFPMGMYTTATYMLVKATGIIQLKIIPDIFIFIAIIGWIYEFTLLVHNMVRKIRGEPSNRAGGVSS